jgi:hypothetical protein
MKTIYDLRREHESIEQEFIKNCKHQYEDGSSAIKQYIDDEDYEDEEGNVFYCATGDEWKQCEICRTQWEI